MLSQLSLWLDEILDLMGVRDHNVPALLSYVAANAGGVPLGYLAQAATVKAFGCSSFSGRLPAAVFSLIACAGLFLLARRLNLRWPMLAVLIFCSTPLQLRYAMEARPYSQALALSIWSTVLFFELADKPRVRYALGYALFVSAGLYTQPYTLFVPCAHLLWLCASRTQPNRLRVLLMASGAVALSCLLFMPWYLYARQFWSTAVQPTHYTIGPGAVDLIIREITGAGYLGAALLFFTLWLAFRKRLADRDTRLFWALYIVVPIVFALTGDVLFGYFLAIRQMIFILPALALIAARGIETVSANRRSFIALVCLLLSVFVAGDIRLFLKPRENWQSASQTLETLVHRGGCVIFVPASSADIYRFFDSALAGHTCKEQVPKEKKVAVAVSPYEDPQKSGDVLRSLQDKGLFAQSEFNPQGPKVYLLARDGYQ